MHSKKVEEVIKEIGSGENGLSENEVKERLKKYGPNEIKEAKKKSKLKIFLAQFNSIVVYILIGAVIISVIIGFNDTKEGFPEEFVDAIVIIILLVTIAVIGFFQEYNAEKAIDALKKLASLKATVIRNGKTIDIDAKELVP